MSSIFEEITRKALLARVVKTRPEVLDLVTGVAKAEEETLIVSEQSLAKRKADYDNLVRVQIPQNREDIKIARSYGDLRENFEYKSAKDMQKFLNHRKAELEKDIGRARGSDFKGADASQVNIGTIVTLADEQGSEQEITVLGAWDSDPSKKIVSYLSEVGKELVGATPGEEVQVRDEETEQFRNLTVKAIRPFVS